MSARRRLPPEADGRQRAASGANRLREDGACRGKVGGGGRECKGERRRARGPRKQSSGLFSAANARARLRGLGGVGVNPDLLDDSWRATPGLQKLTGCRVGGGLAPTLRLLRLMLGEFANYRDQFANRLRRYLGAVVAVYDHVAKFP